MISFQNISLKSPPSLDLAEQYNYDMPPEIHNHTSFLIYIKIIGRKIYEHYNSWMYAVTATAQHAAGSVSAPVTIIPLPSCYFGLVGTAANKMLSI